MVALNQFPPFDGDTTNDETLFGLIAQDIEKQGYSIRHGALPENLASDLFNSQQSIAAEEFKKAGIGRGAEYLENEFVRTDEICWITGDNTAGKNWLDWSSGLQSFLNRRLYLGLFSFESHFAHYGPGDYYKRHYDAFRGEANRVLSVVAYFNRGWTVADAGELVIYRDDQRAE